MACKSRLIGLTGPSGSGKSEVSAILRSKGYPVLDCDLLAREAAAKGTAGLNALVRAFGPSFLASGGELDRKKLGAYVFADPERVRKLNAVTHPYILALLEERLAGLSECPLVFLDAPTLFQSGLNRRCDRIILVTASRALRKERIMRRDGLTEEAAESRMGAQLSDETLRSLCDYVVENDGPLASLNGKLEEVLLDVKA